MFWPFMLIIIATLFVMLASGVTAYRTRSKKLRHAVLQVVACCGLILIGTLATAIASTRNTASLKRANNLRITQATAAASASMEGTYETARSSLSSDLTAYKALATSIENNLLVVWQQNGRGEQATVQGTSYNSSADAIKAQVAGMHANGKYKRLENLDAKIQLDIGNLTENAGQHDRDSMDAARNRSKAAAKLTDLLLHPGSDMNLHHAQFKQQMNIINNQHNQ